MGSRRLIATKARRPSQRKVSNVPQLPPEICDMIIDHLYDNKSTLLNCSLVCRSWLRTARYHLFDSIYVHLEKDPDAFDQFLVYLRATPSVRAYIKDICFDGFVEAHDPPDTLDATFMSSVADLLPKVHTMSIINCQWGKPKNPMDVTHPAKQISLRNLYINSFVADSENTRNKLRVLRHFSYIGHLHLANMWLGHFVFDERDADDFESGIGHLSHPVRVGTMSLSMANICLNFLEYLRIQPFMKTLTSLRILDLFHAEYLEQHQDLTFVCELLKTQLRTTLQELHLEFPRLSATDSADIYNQLNLSSCTALHNIFLRMQYRPQSDGLENDVVVDPPGIEVGLITTLDDIDDNDNNTGPATADAAVSTSPPSTAFSAEEWRAASIVLSQLPACTKSVSLDVELEGGETDVETHLNDLPRWEEIDRSLAKLPKLERVSIRRVKEHSPFFLQWTKKQHDLLLKRLPTLRERKLLQLHWPANIVR